MPTTKEQRAFLATASTLSDQYNAVDAESQTIPLRHTFWTSSEIDHALQIQGEWDLPPTLVPFYGDWHDLICLNTQNGAIVMLDDERKVVFAWPSHDEFLKSLKSVEESPPDTSGIIESESWLDL